MNRGSAHLLAGNSMVKVDQILSVRNFFCLLTVPCIGLSRACPKDSADGIWYGLKRGWAKRAGAPSRRICPVELEVMDWILASPISGHLLGLPKIGVD